MLLAALTFAGLPPYEVKTQFNSLTRSVSEIAPSLPITKRYLAQTGCERDRDWTGGR
jgi:hypothetical protein